MTGVDNSGGFDEERTALLLGAGDVFFALWDNEELSRLDGNGAITKFDGEFSANDEERFVGFGVGVPDKVAL